MCFGVNDGLFIRSDVTDNSSGAKPPIQGQCIYSNVKLIRSFNFMKPGEGDKQTIVKF